MARVRLPEAYLDWLASQLRDETSNPDKSYSELLTAMWETEYYMNSHNTVDNDTNRLADAMDLRAEFSREFGASRSAMLALGSVSFLEVLIGLSRRMAFAAGGSAPGWAWTLLDNLELVRMSDPLSDAKRRRVQDILDTCITRNYRPDGTGGFFPLAFPDEDQTQIEIWYQMHAYIEELHPEH